MVGRKAFFINCAFLFCALLHAEDALPMAVLPESAKTSATGREEGYTINYNTVSIIEYVRFASKICNVNFIFEEADLNFTVTVVSDGPITPENVMATLVQVLRIHGLFLLEQDNNLVIHKAPDVTQIATLVTEKGQGKTSPIVTRIIRIGNIKLDALAGILRPMISSGALLEILPETKQLILTDVTANVDKIVSLIEILDSPSNQLNVKIYAALHNSPDHLVELCSQIMSPIAHGNPYILVPQPMANAIFIVSTNELIEKTIAILTSLDVLPKKEVLQQRKLKGENIFVYKAMNRSSDEILKGLLNIGENLHKSGIPEPDLIQTMESARSIKETNSITFVGSKDAIAKVQEFLAALDIPGKEALSGKPSFFVYRPQNRSAKELDAALREMASNLKSTKGSEQTLIDILLDAKVNLSTNTILFSGDESQFPKIRELLSTIDTPVQGKKVSAPSQSDFYIYKIQHASYEDLVTSLKAFAKNLDKSNVNEDDLIQTIEKMKPITETNSILFTGPESALKRLRELVPSFDSGISVLPVSNQFFIYKPKHAKGDLLAKSIQEVAHNLQTGAFKDTAFLRTLESMKYVQSTNSFLFTGDPASLKKLEELMTTLDLPPSAAKIEKSLWIYPPKYASKEKTETYMHQLVPNLNKETDQDLIDTIRSMKWIDASQSFVFQGPENAMARVKEFMQNFDKPEMRVGKPGYYIYKLQEASGDVVEEELDSLAKDMKKSGLKDDNVLSVIENARYIKETNSLLLTGDPAAIEEVKGMIAEYDYPRTDKGPVSSFFLYKPKHKTAEQIEKSLRDVADNFKQAGLADPSLLNTIDTLRYVETTNSLIFTGNAESIQKIQTLLQDIDLPPKEHVPIQHIGKTTFLLYKLKVAGGPQISTSINMMVADLKKAKTSDPDFLSALNSMKYIKETNSLLFTGTEAALKQVQALVEQFDLPSLAPPAPMPQPTPGQLGQSNFYLYKPVSLPAADLEKLLHDFAENLKSSGLSDPELYSAISSMRYIEKTQSLVFTGTPKALDKIKEILKSFDIAANLPTKTIVAPLEPSIQSIDNTSFLVYKLQFHKGDEIQSAMKQIAKDLLQTSAPINQNLLNSINSIQWLDVTNSLLCSGDQETLTRLKELIKNLDIPLKQVFIEILVVETTLSNALLFGLEWGGNYKYRNKFGVSSFNTVAPPSPEAGGLSQFVQNLSGLVPPAPPTPVNNIPPATGFDLGVIGEVIKHNGQTFLTLGSLLSALQSDNETLIITAPKILGQDGRTSTIFSGSNIPFTGSFVNNTTTGATILTSNVEYRDIGLNLTITPVLGNSDIVTLDINLDRSQTATDITGQTQLNFKAQTANGIITSKTTMQTTVHVPDRNFLVLSGFVNNSTAKTKQGIPCLGGLPMIGAAFSQQNDTISNQNVVIFLRPHIINSIEDMRRVTADQEEFFRDLATTPFLEHSYDDAVELIKTIEDE